MSATTQQAAEIFGRLDEDNQKFALNFLTQLREKEREDRNKAYIDKIDRGIKQCAEGRAIIRDIVKVDGDE